MWLQCVAVILPRVQEHYSVSDRWIGLLSASIFAGMMVSEIEAYLISIIHYLNQ